MKSFYDIWEAIEEDQIEREALRSAAKSMTFYDFCAWIESRNIDKEEYNGRTDQTDSLSGL
jgi:hypothetical protein